MVGIFISLCSLAQTEFNKGISSFGLMIAPSLTHHTYTMHDTSTWRNNPMRDDELPTIGFQLGLFTTYSLNPKLELLGMLSYTQHGTQSSLTEARYADQIGGPPPPPPSSGTVTFYSYQEYFLFLDVSLGARYYLTNGKFKAYISPCIEGNYFVRATYTNVIQYIDQETDINTRDETDEHNFRQFNYTAALGAGVKFPVSSKMSGFIEIKYRKMLDKVADEPVQLYPYSIGLNLGIAYNL